MSNKKEITSNIEHRRISTPISLSFDERRKAQQQVENFMCNSFSDLIRKLLFDDNFRNRVYNTKKLK